MEIIIFLLGGLIYLLMEHTVIFCLVAVPLLVIAGICFFRWLTK